MAVKEMLIVFIYDLEYCKSEQDDPLKAIKYFHPSWVSEQQKLALCGQLIGMLNFCSDFEDVSCISLQNGKFKIEQFGRFILAMGTDRNIQESLLNYRAELMTKILRLYHNDINKIFEQFDDCKNFSDKLYHIFETYLPVLQYNSNLLQNIYKLYLPKSASNLFLDATQIIEHVASKSNVLGGMILYNNKVISTQLSIELTKILVSTDPVRIKTTAEIARNVNFHIPVGCQIIKIYISDKEYQRLQKRIKKVNEATSLGVQNTLPLPFSIKKKVKEPSMMKRDKSLIFTNIPEEEALIEIPSPAEKSVTRTNRPNHLPLKLKTIPPESGIVSFDESDSYPDFIGKTSIASTPMTENKILAGPIQSIFAKSIESQPFDETKAIEMKPLKVDKKEKEIPKEWENVYITFANNPFRSQHYKKKSFDDLRIADENDEISKSYKVYNTITDPIYPIFNERKLPISKILFDDYESLFNSNAKKIFKQEEKLSKFSVSSVPQKIFEADPMIMKRSDIKNSPNRIMRNQKKKMLKLPIKSFSLDLFDSGGKASTSKSSADNSAINNTSIFDSPSTKTKKSQLGGLQLTPLMSKLTLLAMNENENFSTSSFDLPTPNYYMDTPSDNANRTLFNRLSKVDEEKHDDSNFNNDVNENSNEMKRVDLLVIGQQNMTLMVIADEDLCDHVMVQQMFEICVNRLSRLEQKLNEVINVTVDLKASEYSFMTFDNRWNVLQRSGAYDQQTALLIHDSFTANKNVSDVIIRTNDSLVYGHNSGDSEVFYQHPTKQQTGFLAPSEFTIISQAKRKLERDQSILLF